MDAISSRDPSNGELAGSTAPKYFKYSKSGGEQAAAQSRVIKLHEVVSDPLEPAHIKLKKARCLHILHQMNTNDLSDASSAQFTTEYGLT